MNAKQAAAHIRNRIKHEGIKARVRIAPGSDSCVQVFVPGPGIQFSDEEQRKIRLIAKCNGFTRVRGMEINIDQMTDPYDFNFYI